MEDLKEIRKLQQNMQSEFERYKRDLRFSETTYYIAIIALVVSVIGIVVKVLLK